MHAKASRRRKIESHRTKEVAAEKLLWNQLKEELQGFNTDIIKDEETTHFKEDNSRNLANLTGLITSTVFSFGQTAQGNVMTSKQAISISAAFTGMAKILTEITPGDDKKLTYIERLDGIYNRFITAYSETVKSRLDFETCHLKKATRQQIVHRMMAHEPTFDKNAMLQYF